ncbi:MAG TPA: toprim domain-containing protein [Bacteroidales bacterium]|nr:toprim domain-containing protein [Bacteroidales bacterium]HOH84755.1 toprim domain-containing protein [Bacteroidales bacterium]HPB26383.1 toprim domain-containing protein [Bacteroidales bacterium]HPI29884.1 toprim domain-containing protein [Bacteroidales bacterium]
MNTVDYNEEAIRTLEWNEHIRQRPGMYIGKLGDGTSPDDGIYVLLKETIDNAIDEFIMGTGKTIEITIKDQTVTVRDYGRGIPLNKLADCVSKINTGAKYGSNSKVFIKTVGLNGVGSKAVNALSSYYVAQSVREQKIKTVEFAEGVQTKDHPITTTDLNNGTIVKFTPDEKIFGNFHFIPEYVEKMLWNYVFLNNGLTIYFNGQKFVSKNGLLDLLNNNIDGPTLYPVIHINENGFECAITHSATKYNEEYYSFVNGQHTTQGGTHQQAFREAVVKTIREFYKKDFEPSDIRESIIAAISIKIQEPVFESQTKTKLGSINVEPNGATVRNYVQDVIKKHLDDYLHMNPETADILHRKILQSEKDRKELANIKKLAKDSIKKVSLHNKKLRDCRIHYNSNDERRYESTLFITEGDSASGSITKSRDVNTQAVFSLRGKPLNCYGMTKRVCYENEEFNLLQSSLNIEDEIENLRYNNIVIATDADVDGMHIRLLLLTFFLQFYPEVIRTGHLYILQTPLFRVRNKKKTIYCYSDTERIKAIAELGSSPEITRFKGLGEISPDEFKHFIGPNIRLEPVMLTKDSPVKDLLSFYMGKNTPERQDFIIENLRVELDVIKPATN